MVAMFIKSILKRRIAWKYFPLELDFMKLCFDIENGFNLSFWL